MSIASTNPFSGETFATFEPLDRTAIESKVALAHSTFRKQQETFAERARLMNQVAAILDSEARTFGEILTAEMGKTITAAIAEVKKCAAGCHFYAEHAEKMLRPDHIATSAKESYVLYQPLGVILAIMPWNFPFWQVFRFAAPAIMAGNTALLKHASNVPRSALAIQEIFERAGFGRGVFQTLLIGSDAVAALLDDPRIAAATLTGSEEAGRSVGKAAAKNIKKVVLELGGSDPFIVMPSADIERAAKVAVTARTINNGQSCIAAKRFIVHRDVAEKFNRLFVGGMANLRVGDPMLEETEVGPLAMKQIADDIERQVQETVKAGARVATGGVRGKGNFYPPTVLLDVPLDSPAAVEELFGPAAPVFVVDDLEAAIRLANATRFGLGASVWTNSAIERDRFCREIESGQVFVNAMVASDPHVPFGGVKASGHGRELGRDGIREFVNIKTVWVEGGERATE
jgi:succinate-semialdehyde dehydrogenase/glutarate-semialdehyde dehydrogenase